jgi:hypothetical protein
VVPIPAARYVCYIHDGPGRRFTDIPCLKKITTAVFFGYFEIMGFDTSSGTKFRLQLKYEHMARDSELSDQTSRFRRSTGCLPGSGQICSTACCF